MEETLTYEDIWNLLQKEYRSNVLFQLQKDFYEEAERLAAELEREEVEKTVNTKTNVNRLINKIRERRIQKILLYIAYNKQIQQPLPICETNIYNKITQIIDAAKTPANTESIKEFVLNTLQDIPEIYLPSGERIGPLSKESKIKTKDKNDAEFLVNSMLCVYY